MQRVTQFGIAMCNSIWQREAYIICERPTVRLTNRIKVS